MLFTLLLIIMVKKKVALAGVLNWVFSEAMGGK